MEKKKLTKQDILATDVLYIIFSIVIGFCFLAAAVVSIFMLVSSLTYVVKSFMLPSDAIVKAFVLTILMLISSALFIYLDVRLFFTLKKAIKDYLAERKEVLSDLDKEETNS